MTSVGSAPPAFHTENAPFLPRTTARGEAIGLPDRSVDPDSAVEFVTLNDGSETLQMFRRREARVLVEERDGSFRRKRNRWLVLHLLLIEKIVIGARCLPVSGLPRNACSGRLSRVSDGASTGPAPIVAPDVGARKPLGIEYDQFRTDAWASNLALQQNLAERTGFVLRA